MTTNDASPAAPAGGKGGGGPEYSGFETARDRRHQHRYLLASLVFALAYVAAAAALRWRAALPAPVPWALVGLATACAGLAIARCLAFLRAADELLRRIQMEGLAMGFAAGVAVAMLYPLFARLGAPPLDASVVPLVMFAAWTIGSWLGMRRYSRADDEGGSA
ncbi:MAG: hypothetical protein U0X73_15530 [Thermoanaerobaculia bacterium]